jgi:hypothetical protein
VRLSLESWIIVGAFVVDIAGAMPSHRIGLMCSVLPGSKNRAKGRWVVREPWEALIASLRQCPDVGTGVRTPGLRFGVLDRRSEPQAHRRVSPSEGNEARREGHRESHSAIVPSKLGNSPRRTQGRERSEANCQACGCKSRRCKSPCGTVAISGNLRFTGDWKPGRKSPRRPDGH